MVTITNGRETRFVSTGAFNNIYKSKGYHIVDDKKPKKVEKEIVKEVAKEEPIEEFENNESVETQEEVVVESESDWVTELLEKPISQWTKEETASFAKEKNIDTSSAHKLGEAKDIIKKWLDERNR